MNTHDPLPWQPRVALVALLLFVATASGLDLALDEHDQGWSAHLVFELALVGVSLAGLGWLAAAWQRERSALGRTRADLEGQREDRDHWKRRTESLLRGLGAAIDEQLGTWGLTPSESEVALLLLKGLSLKEIA